MATRRDYHYSIQLALVASLLVLLLGIAVVELASAADPDALQDFCVAVDGETQVINGLPCKNLGQVHAEDFRSTLLRMPGNTANNLGVSVTLASARSFPGLNTQGLSMARIDFAPQRGVNPPHLHPRASEILFLAQGSLYVGFVDTNNTLFAQSLSAGDLFVFPKGLIHFQLNFGASPAIAISALSSQNPGVSQVAKAVFSSNPPLPPQVLQIAFGIGQPEVDRIIDGVARTL